MGDFAILDSSVDPTFIDTRSRPVLAQTFEEIATGEQLTVAVNHLKSKGSDCGGGPDDQPDSGGGNCNGTRTAAAIALKNWLATDPTGSGDPDFLIIGDLNSYAKEDPIDALLAAGYTDLADAFNADPYSYVFDGEWGYLDYAMSSATLTPQVTAATEWHINADEPIVLDYNVEFKTAGQITSFYDPAAFRASDHDPMLVGLTLDTAAPDTTIDTNPPDPSNSGDGQFTYSSSEGGDDFECRYDTDPWFDCDGGQVNFFGFSDGSTTFEVRAIDAAGNVDPTPASYTWTIDTTAPDTTIDTNPPDPSASSSASFTFSGNDGSGTGVVSFQCWLDGGGPEACTSPKSYVGLSDGSHTFYVRAFDAAGNFDTTPAEYTWLIDTSTPPADEVVYVTTTAAGVVDGVPFDKNDILRHDNTDGWTLFYNGAGLPNTADISAIHVDAADDLYLSLTQTSLSVSGVGTVKGADVLHYDGSGLDLWFDGSDVGLTTVGEKVDSLHILPGEVAPGPGCLAYVLISTQGAGKVPNGGGTLNFKGEDVLGFCATSLDETGGVTAGTWTMVLDGSLAGMPANATYSLSANDDGSILYFTTKGAFSEGGATGGHSMVYAYDTDTQQFSGPLWSAPAEGLNKKVDGLDYQPGDLP